METKAILHMAKGDGEFSYARNITAEDRVISSNSIKPILETAIETMVKGDTLGSSNVLKVADLGCGVGVEPMALITTVRDVMHKIYMELKSNDDNLILPEIEIYSSDLPLNDFNLLFKEVGELEGIRKQSDEEILCFVRGAPGSFYERLFPKNSLHLVHSNFAIHWLTQVPEGLRDETGRPVNKGNICALSTSPPQVIEAYYSQFFQNFTSFLKCRAQEVVPNGYMILSTICRPSVMPFEVRMDFVSAALHSLVTKGLLEEEKLDSFNVPQYIPCKEEIQEIVTKEGSFEIEHLEVVYNTVQAEGEKAKSFAKHLAKIRRSVFEALISYHFGAQVWNVLYDELCRVILDEIESNSGQLTRSNFVVCLKKKVNI